MMFASRQQLASMEAAEWCCCYCLLCHHSSHAHTDKMPGAAQGQAGQ